jgi:outer membrane protein OmpA-like peptidoglycan-associated protein
VARQLLDWGRRFIRMTAFYARSAATFSVAAIMLIGTGCATKKHVRQTVGPVEARVTQAERRNVEQQAAIGELGNSVSRADEKAMDADRKAREAGEAAKVAHNRADTAFNRADSAAQLAESTRSRYKLVTSEKVHFGVNKYKLSKETKEQLDNAVAQIQNSKNYVLEIQGFTDKTGSASHNLELSRKRADEVVRYLTVQHNIPLRKINVLGVGEEDPSADNSSREGRKEARRVEVRVYSLDLGEGVNAGNTSTSNTNTSSNTSATPAQSSTTATAAQR